MAGAGRIKGITIEIGGNTTKLVSSLKDVDKQIKNTQNALKDVNKLLKLDPGNTELLRQKQKLLTDAIGQTTDRLQQLKDAQSQVARDSSEWDSLQREIIETEQDLSGLKKQMNDFGSVTAQKMKVVGDKFKEAGSKIESAGRSMSKISGLAAGALGGIAKLGYDAVTTADELATLAKRTGVSTDELQKWNYAADLVDVSTESITGAMKKMKKGLDSNTDAFEALGVNVRDNSGNLRSTTDIFYDTIAALGQIENETERDIAAMDIFGKGADELAGIIDDGGKALKEYGKEAEDLGLIIDGETLGKLNETNDTIDKMKATMGASFAQAGAAIAEAFAPALEKVVGWLEKFAAKVRELSPGQAELITKILAVVAVIGPALVVIGKVISAVGTIVNMVSSFVSFIGPIISSIGGLQGVIAALTGPIGIVIAAIAALVAGFTYLYNTNEEFRNKVNAVLEQVKEYFLAFVENVKVWIQEAVVYIQPIIESLQAFFSALGELFGAIVMVIIDVISQIVSAIQTFIAEHQTEINAFMSFIETVVKTKIEVIRTTIKTILDVITNIIKAFTAVLKGDWDGAWEYLKKAASSAKEGLVSIFKTLGNAISGVFKGIVDKFKTWGKDMIDNLINGIKSKIDAVKDTMSDIADAIREYIHFSEPDVGPLSDFHTYAPDMMKEFADGIKQNAHIITDAVSTSFDLRPYMTSMTSGINRLGNIANRQVAAQSQPTPVVVQVALEGDANRLFRVLSEEAHRDWQITGQSKLMGY